ncbi:hypothetical protein Tco_1457457 [Tanacetum coccineum]
MWGEVLELGDCKRKCFRAVKGYAFYNNQSLMNNIFGENFKIIVKGEVHFVVRAKELFCVVASLLRLPRQIDINEEGEFIQIGNDGFRGLNYPSDECIRKRKRKQLHIRWRVQTMVDDQFFTGSIGQNHGFSRWKGSIKRHGRGSLDLNGADDHLCALIWHSLGSIRADPSIGSFKPGVYGASPFWFVSLMV